MMSAKAIQDRERYTSSQNVSRMMRTIPNTTALIVRRTSSTRGRCCGAYRPRAWNTPTHTAADTTMPIR
jgi:hypothetical protein